MKISRKALIVLIAVLCVVLAVLIGAAALLGRGSDPGGDSTGSGPSQQEQTVQTGGDTQTDPIPDGPGETTLPPAADTTAPSETTAPETTEPTQAPSGSQQSKPKGISYPYELESGRLRIESLFQFTGFNPDCEGREGTDIAALQVVNTSGEHLTQADITLSMVDGSRIRFHIRDLPAGMSVMVFSDINVSIDNQDYCTAVSCTASFESTSPMMTDCVTVSTEGTSVTVTNVSGRTLTNVTVYCHCKLGTDCFGGLTYSYTIDSLPAGGSAAVEAWECYLGEAEVVRIGMAG